MSEDFLLEDEDLYQQPEDDDLRETLNKHMQLIGENDYLGFCKWIKKIHPASFRVKVTRGDLKQISNSDCYMKPYEKWKFVPMGNVKKKPYDAMVNVVDYLKKLLEKEGKVA